MVPFLKTEKGSTMFIFPSPHHQDINALQTVFSNFDNLCPGYHIDIMDGIFVPKTMGSALLTNQIAQLTSRQLWVHLMVHNPLAWVNQLALRPGDIVSVHYKTVENEYHQFIKAAQKRNITPSLALDPDDDLKKALPACHAFGHVLIMSVAPGAAGQVFLSETFSTVAQLVAYRAEKQIGLTLAVDGGVSLETAPKLAQSGVDAAAATSAIFGADDPTAAFKTLCQLAS